MAIYSRGWGDLVPVICLLQYIVTKWVVNSLQGVPDFYTTHGWPKFVGCLAGGLTLWLVGQYLRRRDKLRFLVDTSTGQHIPLASEDSFSGIPVRFWGLILAGFGCLLFFVP
jgi:hypothetical protein